MKSLFYSVLLGFLLPLPLAVAESSAEAGLNAGAIGTMRTLFRDIRETVEEK